LLSNSFFVLFLVLVFHLPMREYTQVLAGVLQQLQQLQLGEQCPVNARGAWMAAETRDSAWTYRQTLRESEFTLAPAGINTLCYRFLEAVASGSTPVVEAVTTPPSCRHDPWQLFKVGGD
jgi:hypothetical protein